MAMGPRLTDGQRANFETLKRAAEHGRLALVSMRWAATGEPVAVIVAVSDNGDGTMMPVPLAAQFAGDPYVELEAPFDEEEG